MRLELIRVGLLVELANHYTTKGTRNNSVGLVKNLNLQSTFSIFVDWFYGWQWCTWFKYSFCLVGWLVGWLYFVFCFLFCGRREPNWNTNKIEQQNAKIENIVCLWLDWIQKPTTSKPSRLGPVDFTDCASTEGLDVPHTPVNVLIWP